MSNSFQLPSYSVTLNSTSATSYTYVAPTVTVVAGGTGNVHIGGGSSTDYVWAMPKEWEECFPEWGHVQDMCKEYPGLKIAFEKFRTTYNLLKDDYVSKNSQK
jgi:hypothetical protein